MVPLYHLFASNQGLNKNYHQNDMAWCQTIELLNVHNVGLKN